MSAKPRRVDVERSTVEIATLNPWPLNPRTIDVKAYRGLKASVKRFGLVQEIVVNRRNMRVVGGHQRLKALRDLGEKRAPVVFVDLPETEEMALNVSLNNPAITGEFTDDLQAILAELSQLPELEFEELRLDALLDSSLAGIVEDEVPEPPKNPVTKAGDLWILGDHRLLCGDSTKREDATEVLGEAHPLLMVTDPPYGVEYDPG